MQEVTQMLKEEGINYDHERGGFIDESNNLLDIDINRILEEYMEHMDKAYELVQAQDVAKSSIVS